MNTTNDYEDLDKEYLKFKSILSTLKDNADRINMDENLINGLLSQHKEIKNSEPIQFIEKKNEISNAKEKFIKEIRNYQEMLNKSYNDLMESDKLSEYDKKRYEYIKNKMNEDFIEFNKNIGGDFFTI